MADENIEIAAEATVSTPGLEDLAEAEQKKREAERDKISLVEMILLLMVAAAADFFEIIAGLSIVLLIIGLFFGFLASSIIFLWAVLRGGTGYLIFRRIIITVGGWFLDVALLGIFPIRTIALILTFWINNHNANKRIKEATTKIEEIEKTIKSA